MRRQSQPCARAAPIVLLICALGAAPARPPFNYDQTITVPTFFGPRGTLFGWKPGATQVYVASIESREVAYDNDISQEGHLFFKVVRSLTEAPDKTLRLHYSYQKPGVGGGSSQAGAYWPDMSTFKKGDLFLLSVDKGVQGRIPPKDLSGEAVDVAPLNGLDDPLIAQVQRMVKLRDTTALPELEAQCKEILDAPRRLLRHAIRRVHRN